MFKKYTFIIIISSCLQYGFFGMLIVTTIVSASFVQQRTVITKPKPEINYKEELDINPNRTPKMSKVRIMKSRREDLEDISGLLSHASYISNNSSAENSSNWRMKMERLRLKSDLQMQLKPRLDAVTMGSQMVTHISHSDTDFEQQFEDDWGKILWSCDNFRSKVEKAAKLSTERTSWKNYDFNLKFPDLDLLQHCMISVQDKFTSEIIGFCEIAMIATPDQYQKSNRNDDCELRLCERQIKYIPTLVNLVISPKHRRKGLASRLVQAAARYVKSKWRYSSFDEGVPSMGLYVDEDNVAALALYKREGFVTVGRSNESNKLLFMERSFNDNFSFE